MSKLFSFYCGSVILTSILMAFAILMRMVFRNESGRIRCFIWMFLLVRLLLPVSLEVNNSILPKWISQNVVSRIEMQYQKDMAITDAAAVSQTDINTNKNINTYSDTNNNGNTNSHGNTNTNANTNTNGNADADINDATGKNNNVDIDNGSDIKNDVNIDMRDGKPELGKASSAFIQILRCLWYAGICLFLFYSLVQRYFLLRKQQRSRRSVEEDVYEWQDDTGACVIGVLKPRIYIPAGAGLDEHDRMYVINHERMHIKRKDTLFIRLYYLALLLYWYHPLCWVVYYLVWQDIEYACDEQVLQDADAGQRTQYAQTLLKCCQSNAGNQYAALSFGTHVKRRIVNIGKRYRKKPVLSVCVCLAGSVIVLLSALTQAENRYAQLSAVKAQTQFDAQMPRLLYVNEKYILFEDNQGIYHYSLTDRCIEGFCEFEALGLGGLEGDDAVSVRVDKSGKEIFLEPAFPELMNGGGDLQYVYHVSTDSVSKQKEEIVEDMLYLIDATNEYYENEKYFSLSNVYPADGGEIYFLALEKVEHPDYSNLLYVVVGQDEEEVYRVFE